MIMDLWQYEEGTLPEIAVVVDMDRVTLSHISAIDVTVAQQFFYFLQVGSTFTYIQSPLRSSSFDRASALAYSFVIIIILCHWCSFMDAT